MSSLENLEVQTEYVEQEVKKPKRIMIEILEEINPITDEVEETVVVRLSKTLVSPLDVCRYLSNAINDVCVNTQASVKVIKEAEEREKSERKLHYSRYIK